MNDLNLSSIDNLSLVLGDTTEVIDINTADIIPDPDQPRKERNAQSDKELSNSVKEKGVLQPIVLRPMDDLGKHMIVFGHRRFDASIDAKMNTIPCLIKDIHPDEILSIQAIENIQREDMALIDEARAIAKLSAKFGIKETAKILSKKSQDISKRVRIHKANSYIHDFIKLGFSNDVAAYYELTLLDNKHPDQAKELIDDWGKYPALRTSLRGQIEGIKKKLSPKKENDNNSASLAGSQKIDDIASIKEVESLVSGKNTPSPKSKRRKNLNTLNAEPESFEIKTANHETLLSFKYQGGENVEINIPNNLWSKFVDEINKR